MIELQKLTPKVYYNESRDFQFIGRLFDLILNDTKTNVELINNLPLNEGADSNLIDLMAMTLGFKLKHNYSVAQLTALCSVFMKIMRNKGSIYAIQMAGDTLVHAEGITKKFFVEIDTADNQNLLIYLPSQFTNLSLFKDLLTYILPAGMTYQVIISDSHQVNGTQHSIIKNEVIAYNYKSDKKYENENSAIIPKLNAEYANDWANSDAKNTPGLIMNSTIVKATKEENSNG